MRGWNGAAPSFGDPNARLVPEDIEVTQDTGEDGELAVDIAIVDQTTGRTLWERKGLVVTGEYDEDREVEGRRQALEDVVTALVEGAQSQW